jgi:vanillate/4-hydroxybenzoate decarboxylase subunit D
MSPSTTQVTPQLVCPRCRSNTIEVRAVSPKAGVWTVYGCDTCFYTWRSTEPEENTNPDKYPAVFRLLPENLPKLEVAPSIPPLRPPQP